MEEALRIEWSKAYARTRRWREEVRLLAEEVRRLPISLEHEAQKWERRARDLELESRTVEEGEGAMCYALKQAATYREISGRVAVTMTKMRLGKGKPRIMPDINAMMADVQDDGVRAEDGEGDDEDEDEGIRLRRGDMYDDEHVLAGGEDD
ncbi:hypothetical protein C8R45DRAFT_1101215 [Mycena sanguinolenta]|nr:hypothetical protein C8R45DRAFT_1101215 [Mycena sanguinolenta]